LSRPSAIAAAKRLLLDANVKDPGPKVDQLPSVTKPEDQVVDPLASVIEAYQNQPHTPELVTQTHQAIWQVRGEFVGASFEVTPCPYTREQLADLEASGKRVGYLPAELATQQTRHRLGGMFQEGNSVTNDEDPSGWFDYEVAIKPPYPDTKEGQLMDMIENDGRKILSLNQYIVASQDSKLFTGKYLDEDSNWVRLGSRLDGRIVDAHFSGDGDLCVLWSLNVGDHYPFLGGRSSGVKKA